MIFCTRATRAIEDQPGLPLKMTWGIGKTRAVESQSVSIPRENEQAWKKYVYRSMRAVEGSLGHS
jgi:hypothetical protein